MSARFLPARPSFLLARAGARVRQLHATAARAKEPLPERNQKLKHLVEHAKADPKVRDLMQKVKSDPDCTAAMTGLSTVIHSAMASKNITGKPDELGFWDKMKLLMDKDVREKGKEAIDAFKKAGINPDMETIDAMSKLSRALKADVSNDAKKD